MPSKHMIKSLNLFFKMHPKLEFFVIFTIEISNKMNNKILVWIASNKRITLVSIQKAMGGV